ncbi:hypothetical protein LWI29_032124 [Acer saccharum]|uniref:Uncharacterized protein n=1 Tax=Acer saccharum TaxID=4024 RepID=A0AA39S058_ACESA|nr:hypothetical protein LWI29_032124 [Acer saccharum]
MGACHVAGRTHFRENLGWDAPIHVAMGPSNESAPHIHWKHVQSMWHTCGTLSLNGPMAMCMGPSQPRFSPHLIVVLATWHAPIGWLQCTGCMQDSVASERGDIESESSHDENELGRWYRVVSQVSRSSEAIKLLLDEFIALNEVKKKNASKKIAGRISLEARVDQLETDVET